MQSRLDPYTFDPVDWDESNWFDADDHEQWLVDQALDEFGWLSGIVADLEDLNDDDQVSYLSDLDLTSAQYTALDAIRNQTTEIHA